MARRKFAASSSARVRAASADARRRLSAPLIPFLYFLGRLCGRLTHQTVQLRTPALWSVEPQPSRPADRRFLCDLCRAPPQIVVILDAPPYRRQGPVGQPSKTQ